MPRLVLRSHPAQRPDRRSGSRPAGLFRPGRVGSVSAAAALVLAMTAPSGAAALTPTPGEPAVRGVASLVLGHPDTAAARQAVASAVDVAVGRVTAIWGPGWSRQVTVVLPDTQQEASDLLGPGVDLDRLAAVATADRVVLNPRTFPTLSAVGSNLVLTHEVMHLASRAATGPHTPLWLVEGLADYAGYQGLGVPLGVAAAELRAELQRGEAVTTLPSRADFDGANPELAASYEQAWLAVVRIVERYGQTRLLALYRAIGAARSAAGADLAFRSVLGTTRAAFEQEWAAHLTAVVR